MQPSFELGCPRLPRNTPWLACRPARTITKQWRVQADHMGWAARISTCGPAWLSQPNPIRLWRRPRKQRWPLMPTQSRIPKNWRLWCWCATCARHTTKNGRGSSSRWNSLWPIAQALEAAFRNVGGEQKHGTAPRGPRERKVTELLEGMGVKMPAVPNETWHALNNALNKWVLRFCMILCSVPGVAASACNNCLWRWCATVGPVPSQYGVQSWAAMESRCSPRITQWIPCRTVLRIVKVKLNFSRLDYITVG